MRVLPRDLRERIESGGRDLTVLVVRLGAFGDVLRSLPPVRLLRKALPEARIEWVADDRWAEFLLGHPDLNEVVAFPRSVLRAQGRVHAARELLGWIRALRARRPGVVLDFHGNFRSGLVSLLSGAPVRLGYAGHQQKEGNRIFTTHRVPEGNRRASRMERNLALIRALGVPDSPLPDGGIPVSTRDRDAAREIVRRAFGDRPYAVLSPGASRGQVYKKPPGTLLAAAAAELAAHGIGSIVAYGPDEVADAAAVVREAGSAARLAPPTTLRQLAELIRAASAFVGGDSGPLHLACAVGCPVLGLYGPTDPEVNAPWGVRSVALFPPDRVYRGVKRKDRAGGGFDGLAATAVTDGVRRLVDGSPNRRNES